MPAYTLKPGNDWNPLRKGEARNLPCPCGSGRKSKKCHGLFNVMPKGAVKVAADYVEAVRSGQMPKPALGAMPEKEPV